MTSRMVPHCHPWHPILYVSNFMIAHSRDFRCRCLSLNPTAVWKPCEILRCDEVFLQPEYIGQQQLEQFRSSVEPQCSAQKVDGK